MTHRVYDKNVMLFLGFLLVLFQKVFNGFFKEFVGGTLLVNSKDFKVF